MSKHSWSSGSLRAVPAPSEEKPSPEIQPKPALAQLQPLQDPVSVLSSSHSAPASPPTAAPSQITPKLPKSASSQPYPGETACSVSQPGQDLPDSFHPLLVSSFPTQIKIKHREQSSSPDLTQPHGPRAKQPARRETAPAKNPARETQGQPGITAPSPGRGGTCSRLGRLQGNLGCSELPQTFLLEILKFLLGTPKIPHGNPHTFLLGIPKHSSWECPKFLLGIPAPLLEGAQWG